MKNNEVENIYMKDLALKKLYKDSELSYEISKMVAVARIDKGLTQDELARKIGTKQPSIARIESYVNLPSLAMLQKIAEALDLKLQAPCFVEIEKESGTESFKVINVIREFFLANKYGLKGAISGDTCVVDN